MADTVGTKIRGKKIELFWGTAEPASKQLVVRNLEKSVEAKEIDASDCGSGAWGETETGDLNATITGEAFLLSGDTNQQALEQACINGTTLYFEIRENGTGATLPKETFQGKLTNFKQTASVDDMQRFSFTIKSKGALTRGAQAAA
jgi:hypothetical protein